MLYIDESCVFCNEKFLSGDDVVVCPDCGSPHHRHCWLAEGACANASLHADGYLWQPNQKEQALSPETAASDLTCAVCGAKNAKGSADCARCGNTIYGPDGQPQTRGREQATQPPSGGPMNKKLIAFLKEFPPTEKIGKVSAKELAVYVQIGAKRYINKFRKIEAGQKKLSWSWPAFFFSPYWFFYRKMYRQGGIFLGLSFAFSLLFSEPLAKVRQIIDTLPPVPEMTALDYEQFSALLAEYSGVIILAFGLGLLLRLTAALIAVPLYKKKATDDILALKRYNHSPPVLDRHILRRGGTSGLGLIGGVLLNDLLWLLVNFFTR
ncbi:MAG: DUF2628 domain-containing protein [Clostridiales bacterium]|nr:DUF2628 domain-containing protein [Clostridiales bacterium]